MKKKTFYFGRQGPYLEWQSDDDDEMAIETWKTYGMLAQTLQNIPVLTISKSASYNRCKMQVLWIITIQILMVMQGDKPLQSWMYFNKYLISTKTESGS